MMVVEKPSKLVAGLFCLASMGFQRPKRDPRRVQNCLRSVIFSIAAGTTVPAPVDERGVPP